MKKFICLFVTVILIFTFCFPFSAHADVLTISQIASAAYAYAQAAGINFTFTGGTEDGSKSWMENKVDSWLQGRSIVEAFGDEVLRVEVGKLIIPATLGMNIASFLRDLISNEGITIDNPVTVQEGLYEGVPLSNNQTSFVYDFYTTGINMFRPSGNPPPIAPNKGDGVFGESWLRTNTSELHKFINRGSAFSFHYWNITQLDNGKIRCNYVTSENDVFNTQTYDFDQTGQITDKLDISLSPDYAYPEFPDVGYQWEGTITGAAPDTNLDQLLGIIDTDIPDNNLVIEGEVVNPIDPPVPPTPVPVDPDTPLQDVPWEGLNDLIDSSTETINEGIRDQTDAITGAQEATTEAVESLTETIDGALDTPTSEQLPQFKFDLRELFPFCIPFDIYRLLSSFDAEPVAPHVQLPIVINSIGFSYMLDLDFSAWNPVAQAMRTAELIVYAIGLAWATGKVIKW